MRKRTDKEQAEYLKNKLKLKELNGMDYTDELCDMLEFILAHDTGESDPDAYTKEFMKTHSIILPAEKNKRMEILVSSVEQVLPELEYNNPELTNSVKNLYIMLDAIANEIWKYSEEEVEDIGFPEDIMIEKICKLLPEKGVPNESYYDAVREYLSFLMTKLKDSLHTSDIKAIKAIGLRANLQSIQFEQLYEYQLLKR